MTEQIHKRLTEEQVEMILNRYNNNELSRESYGITWLKTEAVFRVVEKG